MGEKVFHAFAYLKGFDLRFFFFPHIGMFVVVWIVGNVRDSMWPFWLGVHMLCKQQTHKYTHKTTHAHGWLVPIRITHSSTHKHMKVFGQMFSRPNESTWNQIKNILITLNWKHICIFRFIVSRMIWWCLISTDSGLTPQHLSYIIISHIQGLITMREFTKPALAMFWLASEWCCIYIHYFQQWLFVCDVVCMDTWWWSFGVSCRDVAKQITS